MDVSDLQIGQLRLLEALVETGSLSAAAERIGLSQPAASHALARLRRALGDPLFVRTSKGVRPTPHGERLAASARAALQVLRDALEAGGDFKPRTSSRVFNVFLSDVGQMVMLPGLLAHLKREAPAVALRVHPVPVRDPGVALETGEVDLAVGYFTTLSTGFRERRLFRERYVCVARADHPAFASGMSRAAFLSAPHALADSSGMAHAWMERELARHRLRRRVMLRVPQFMVLALLVARSDLVVVMPSRLAEEFARLVRIKVMAPPVPIPPYDIKVFWHERFHHDPANRWLRDTFVRLFADRSAP